MTKSDICIHHRWVDVGGGVTVESCDVDPDLIDVVLSCSKGTWCPYYEPLEVV